MLKLNMCFTKKCITSYIFSNYYSCNKHVKPYFHDFINGSAPSIRGAVHIKSTPGMLALFPSGLIKSSGQLYDTYPHSPLEFIQSFTDGFIKAVSMVGNDEDRRISIDVPDGIRTWYIQHFINMIVHFYLYLIVFSNNLEPNMTTKKKHLQKSQFNGKMRNYGMN